MAQPASDPDLFAPAKVRVLDGVTDRNRDPEFAWIHEHAHAYSGQWVVLDGDRLLAASFDLDEIYARLSPEETERALFHRVVLD